MRAVLPPQRYTDFRHAREGLAKAQEACDAARKLRLLCDNRYNALVRAAGFDPSDTLVYEDSTRSVSDGLSDRVR